MRKLFLCLLVCLCMSTARAADNQTGGRVILDLQPDEDIEEKEGVPALIELGAAYIRDVQEYGELLEGSSLERDFSDDIMAKYPRYNKKTAEAWQNYVRRGIKAYRFYEELKRKVIDWLVNQEIPLVVADDQYEMGEPEEYIESDKPVVIKDFKKVVAYSDSEKDHLAVREKIARDHNLVRPSELIARYKKAFLEKDWATLFDFNIKEYIDKLYEKPDGRADIRKQVSALILPRLQGIGPDGRVTGVIEVMPREDILVLFRDYDAYKGISVDFSASENLEEVRTGFMLPQAFVVDGGKDVLGYTSQFGIYFEGKAKDAGRQVVLRPTVTADLCRGKKCETVELTPETVLPAVEHAEKTTFSSYVDIVSRNIPREDNADDFEFLSLVMDKGAKNRPDALRLEVKSKNNIKFKIFIVSDEAKYFSAPKIRIDDEKTVARFELLDPSFDPQNKEITFLAAMDGTSQYLHKMAVERASWLDTENTGISVGMLFLAFIGGLLLNLMPFTLPVLILKLLKFSGFGGKNRKHARHNFLWSSAGILSSFVLIAVLLAWVKASGGILSWGMQFQNVYFQAALVWGILLFLMYVLGIVGLRHTGGKAGIAEKRLPEFFSGVFLVLLAIPCTAPYLETIFSIVFSESPAEIAAVVMAAGTGLALPYMLVAAYPGIAFCMPRPGKWMDAVKMLAIFMLLAALGWLLVLIAQSSFAAFWRWILYLTTAFILLFFRKTVNTEIDKLDDSNIVRILHRRAGIFFGAVLLILAAVSFWDAGRTAADRREFMAQTTPTRVNLQAIDENIRQGNKVLVKIAADWCMACKYNDTFVFDIGYMQDFMQNHNVKIFEIDATEYDAEVSGFIRKFGRFGVPFYVLFSPAFPEGIALPKILNDHDLRSLIEM